MAAAVPFIMVAGATMSAIGALQQGSAARAAAQFNASIQQQNVEISKEQTTAQVRQADREAYLRLGAIRAAAGASGGKQQGSVLDILADTAAQNEIQRQDIIYKGELQQRGFLNTAALDEFGGEQAQKSSYLAAGSELLKGVGNAYAADSRMMKRG